MHSYAYVRFRALSYAFVRIASVIGLALACRAERAFNVREMRENQ